MCSQEITCATTTMFVRLKKYRKSFQVNNIHHYFIYPDNLNDFQKENPNDQRHINKFGF